MLKEIEKIAGAELELAGPPTADARLLEDLALDSLGLTVLAVGLENRFRVKLDEQDADGIFTVRDLAALVVRRAAESSRPARKDASPIATVPRLKDARGPADRVDEAADRRPRTEDER